MTTVMLVLAAMLRDATLSTPGSDEAMFGLPQALVIIGVVVLLALLVGVVIWRVRRTRSK
jgi:hypothetical protein